MLPLKDNIPTDRFPVVTVALIVVNFLVYFLFQKAGITHGPSNHNTLRYAAVPCEFTHPGKSLQGGPGGAAVCAPGDPLGRPSPIATIFLAMFMHGSIVHIGGNMLFLWIFGNNVEDSMGRVRFLLFYLAGGVAALALQTAVNPGSAVPTLGASGAIAAVLGGYIFLYPRARVVTVIFLIIFFTILELPALVVLGLWFVQQAIFGALDLTTPAGGGGGGVAYFAHIGGFVFGLLVIRLLAQRRKSVPPRLPVY